MDNKNNKKFILIFGAAKSDLAALFVLKEGKFSTI
jgi:hypothetical protein